MWLAECPENDQGLLIPIVTASGRVVLLCDSADEVWLSPDDVGETEPYLPGAPEWEVVPGVHVAPDTTRWAEPEDLPAEWRSFTFHEGP